MAFLGILCKKGYEVDLIRPLRKFIEETYGGEQAANHKQALEDFQNLRAKVLSKLNDRHESAVEILSRYYDQLVAVETKIPMAENAVRIDFKWQDAFDQGSLFGGRNSLKMQSSGFERIAILFNIASISSQVAADSANGGDDQSLKTAAKLFQQSAGLFAYLKHLCPTIIQRDATIDLTKDCLGALSALMLAQAQDCIFHKAAKDKMKAAIVAKIAAQGGDLYNEAKTLLGINSMKSLWPKEWLTILNCKHIAFQALAQFFQGHAAGESRLYGEQIARYKYAEELMKSSQSKGSYYGEYYDRMKRSLAEAEKDNNVIYHDVVPATNALSKIDRAVLAKEIVPTFPLTEGNRDLFDRLVSVAVHNAMTTFENFKKQAVNFEIGRLREGTDLMNSVLSSLNLPASLEDDASHDVPPSVLEKAAKIRQAGGITTLKEAIENLPDLLQRNKDILNESRRMLDEEKESDDKLRQQFGAEKWNRTPSDKLTDTWRQELDKFQRIVDQATQSDCVVMERYKKHADAIALMTKSDSEIRAALPKGNTAVDPNNSQQKEAKDRLKVLCNRVEDVKNQRKQLEHDVQNSAVENIGAKLSEALTQDGAMRVEDLSQDYVNKLLAPLREQISASLQEQESLLGEIQQQNTIYTGGHGAAAGATQNRAELLSNMASAFDQFEQLRSNLQEGSKFYGDLTEILLKFQGKVQDFCFARRTEKEELMKDLQSSMVRQRTDLPTRGDNTEAPKTYPPPPRPPPLSSNNSPAAPPAQSAPVAPAYSQPAAPPPANAPGYAPPPAAAAAAPAPNNYPQQGPPPGSAPGYAPQGGPPPNYPQQGPPPSGAPGYPQGYPQQHPPPGGPGYSQPHYVPGAPPPQGYGNVPGYLPYPTQPYGGMPQPGHYVPGMPPPNQPYYPGGYYPYQQQPQGGYPPYGQNWQPPR